MVRLEPRLVEFHEILARHFFDAGGGPRARQWISISMPRPIQEARKNSQPHLNRSGLLALDRGDLEFLLALKIGIRKRGIENDVSEEIQRRIQF